MWAWRALVRSYFEVVLIYVVYGRFTIKIHEFMHSLLSGACCSWYHSDGQCADI